MATTESKQNESAKELTSSSKKSNTETNKPATMDIWPRPVLTSAKSAIERLLSNSKSEEIPKTRRKREKRDPRTIERANLLNVSKLIIKELIDSSMSHGRMLDDDHEPLQQFFIVLEHVLRHGLRPKKSILRDRRDFWCVLELVERLVPEAAVITTSVREMPHLKTPLGKARAWLRLAAMQKTLADYFKVLLEKRDEVLSEFYEPGSMMIEDEGIVIAGLLVGLNVIDCNLGIKDEDLDQPMGVVDFSLYLKDTRLNDSSPDEESAEGKAKMQTILDQKNYLEELNRHLNATVTELQRKLDASTTTNALMTEDLAIAKNSLLELEEEKTVAESQRDTILHVHRHQVEGDDECEQNNPDIQELSPHTSETELAITELSSPTSNMEVGTPELFPPTSDTEVGMPPHTPDGLSICQDEEPLSHNVCPANGTDSLDAANETDMSAMLATSTVDTSSADVKNTPATSDVVDREIQKVDAATQCADGGQAGPSTIATIASKIAKELKSTKRRSQSETQKDIDVERQTYLTSRAGLDTMYADTKAKLDEEIQVRLDIERELELQIGMKQEMEMALRLLEKDIFEKQDSIIGLRKQLEDIKGINLQMYSKLETCDSSLKHKTEMVTKLEEKTNQLVSILKDMEKRLKHAESDKQAAEETARKLGQVVADKDARKTAVETDLRIEREWRGNLQANLEQEKTRSSQLQNELVQLRRLKEEHSQLQKQFADIKIRCEEQEKTLAELGSHLSESKLRVEDMRELHQANKEATWASDRQTNNCKQCEKPFSVARRKHHCRNCGDIYCAECSDNKMPHPSSSKPVRVCDSCQEILLQRYSAGGN